MMVFGKCATADPLPDGPARRLAGVVLLLAAAFQVPAVAADASGESGSGRAAIFADDPPPSKEAGAGRSALFGDRVPAVDEPEEGRVKVGGFAEFKLAYTMPSPAHWSRVLTRAQVDVTGAFSPEVRWKLSGRLDYDAVYDLTDFYSSAVADDARFNAFARENYVDIGAGDWDFRLGRQQIVWGEMVGLFAADVVSAKDLREFVLPDFDIIRIPQWALRAEYSKDAFHAELVWIPVASYNEIGVPGSEFYAYPPPPPPGYAEVIEDQQTPSRSLSHTNYGMRLSMLRDGWDVAGYYYGSMDQSPTYYRTIVSDPQPTFIYQPRHERIQQGGFTMAKDFRYTVLKAETVYTRGRMYNVNDLTVPDGLVEQDTIDWVVGFDFNLPVFDDTRLNLQAFQRIYLDYDSRLSDAFDKYESGVSIYLNSQFGRGWEGTLLWGTSVNRTDWMLQLAVSRKFERNWLFQVGADIFDGPPQGLFGQYRDKDRVYTRLVYTF